MFVGFASTIMFGFTPSIPSMERMYIFFYYGNMLAILIFIKQIIEKRIKTGYLILFHILCIFYHYLKLL